MKTQRKNNLLFTLIEKSIFTHTTNPPQRPKHHHLTHHITLRKPSGKNQRNQRTKVLIFSGHNAR
ncbi:MAG: hypothetical protein K2N86_00015, partial [Rikenellaceae bacterium]|nr:hypothetical protein [Rikenellaceae bacterium]